MACQLFGPYDPVTDPPSTLTDWIASCPSSGGPFPQARVHPDGSYSLYCCSNPTDVPTVAGDETLVLISLRGLLELVKSGRLSVGRGKVVIRVPREPKPKRR
jgi:hypothetical protein